MQPVQRLIRGGDLWPVGRLGAVDQHDLDAQIARGLQLGAGRCATAVLGDQMGDAMRLHQGAVALHRERAARQHDLRARQWGCIGGIDQAQQPAMWQRGKGCQGLLADGQKDAGGRMGQRCNRTRDVGGAQPVRVDGPCRAAQHQHRHTRGAAGGIGVAADLGCKGMRGVNDRSDFLIRQIPGQTVSAPKPADPCGQGLGDRRTGASGIGKNCGTARLRQLSGQAAGLGRAAQQQDASHV